MTPLPACPSGRGLLAPGAANLSGPARPARAPGSGRARTKRPARAPLTRRGACCPSASSGAPAAAGCCPSCRPRLPPWLPRPPRSLGRRPVRPPRRHPPAPRRPGGGGGGSGRAWPAARGRARERRATRGAARAARPTDTGAPWTRVPLCARSPRASRGGGRLCPRRRRSVPAPTRAHPATRPPPTPRRARARRATAPPPASDSRQHSRSPCHTHPSHYIHSHMLTLAPTCTFIRTHTFILSRSLPSIRHS